MIYVYWIKRKSHTNILNEGYVGITNDVSRRLPEHKRSTNPHLERALNKYDDIEIITVYEFDTLEEALTKEYELRPDEKIGWNLARGGGMPPQIKYYPEVHKKISNTIKKMGVIPYCEKTHSPEAIAKSKATKKKNKGHWFHNPETLEYKFIRTALEDVPEGWVSGRVPTPVAKPKVRGIDYQCNAGKWIIDDGAWQVEVTNLKQWCKDHNIPYLAGYKDRKWKNYTVRKI